MMSLLVNEINHVSDEPETRDTWWMELRTEIRSHARAMGCHAVVGYRERTTICDEIIVLSACGTAAAVNLQMAPLKTSTLLTASLDRTMFDKEQLTAKKEKHKLFVDINLANQAARSHFTSATADGYVFDFVVGTYRTNIPGGTVM